MNEDTIEMVARIAHEANRSYCFSIGDATQKSWNEAPDWQKKSAIDGVNFHLANPDAGPEGSHKNWLATKKADGWKYGLTKNEQTKEHPCMVPYEELSPIQRQKDFIFTAIVKSFVDGPYKLALPKQPAAA